MWERRFGVRRARVSWSASLVLSALVLVAGWACVPVAAVAAAQEDTPGWNKTPKPKTEPTPKSNVRRPTPQPARPRPQRTTPVVRPPQGPMLSLQYRVFKVEPSGSEVEVNPVTVFGMEDRIRFGFKANEDGYITIIRQSDPNMPGRILFPDSRINNGHNFVKGGQELVVPTACASARSPIECTYPINGNTGQDYYTVIFSRDPSPNLPPDAVQADGNVRPQSLRQYWAASGQKLSEPQRGDTIFSQKLTNLNPRSGDEIIIRYFLNKRPRTANR